MQNVLKCLWGDEQGQDLTEYALLLILIGLVGTASMAAIGQTVRNVFSNAAANLTT